MRPIDERPPSCLRLQQVLQLLLCLSLGAVGGERLRDLGSRKCSESESPTQTSHSEGGSALVLPGTSGKESRSLQFSSLRKFLIFISKYLP